MLVTAEAILVRDRITMDQLKLADELLDKFVSLCLNSVVSQSVNFLTILLLKVAPLKQMLKVA